MNHDMRNAIEREMGLRRIRREGREFLTGRERYDFLAIKEKHDRARNDAEALYRKEYKTRVDVAYRVLLRKAGSPTPDLKPRFLGHDRFNKTSLYRDAQRLVRFEHQQVLARLDEREFTDSHAFLEKCSARRRYVEAFKAASRQQPSIKNGAQRSHNPSLSD